MFLKQDGKRPGYQQVLDNVLMLMVNKDKQETGRESRRSMKPSYPPARNGATNYEPGFTTTPKKKKPQFDMQKLAEMVLHGNGGSGQGKFNPAAILDPSQVEDLRGNLNPRKIIDDRQMMLEGRGAYSGDGTAERPAPAFGMALAPDGYPGQSAPAGGSNREALIQMLMQRMKSGSMRL